MKADEMREISARVASEADATDAYNCMMVMLEEQAKRGEFHAAVTVTELVSSVRDFTTPIRRRLMMRLAEEGYRVKFIDKTDPGWTTQAGDTILVTWEDERHPRFDLEPKPGFLKSLRI